MKNAQIKTKQKVLQRNKYEITFFGRPTNSEYDAWSGVWLIYSGRCLWRKIIFPLPETIIFQVVSWLWVVLNVHFSTGIVSGLNLCMLCTCRVYAASVSVSTCIWKTLFPIVFDSNNLFILFCINLWDFRRGYWWKCAILDCVFQCLLVPAHCPVFCLCIISHLL